MESIKNLIDEFEGSSPSDSTFLRARSRLAHVSSRILRMSLDVEATQEQKDYRNESYATCLHFEAELYEKISLNTTIQASISNASSVTTPTVISVPIPTQTKTVAIYKWDLKFDGVPKQFEVESFIERVEELAKARGVSKEQLFNSAVDLFVGKGIDWWRYVKPSVNDWHSLTSRLKSDFLPKDYDENVWKIIKERKQNSNESVTIFIAELESYFRRLSNQPAEITKISWIKRNLNYQLYEKIALEEVGSVSDLGKLCKRWEEVFDHKKLEEPAFNKVNSIAHREQVTLKVNSLINKQTCSCSNNVNNVDNNNTHRLRTQKYNSFLRNSNTFSNSNNNSSRQRHSQGNSSSNRQRDTQIVANLRTSYSCWNCNVSNH